MTSTLRSFKGLQAILIIRYSPILKGSKMKKIVVMLLAGVLATGLMAKPPHKGGGHYKAPKHKVYKQDNASSKAYTKGNKEASHLKELNGKHKGDILDHDIIDGNKLERKVKKEAIKTVF